MDACWAAAVLTLCAASCVVAAGTNPVFDYAEADLVARNLSQLSFMNMKKLFAAGGCGAAQPSSRLRACRWHGLHIRCSLRHKAAMCGLQPTDALQASTVY